MTAVVFGATGQDGHYLIRLLLPMGIKVIGISRNGTGIRGDISEFGFVEQQLKRHKPEYIFHFAAHSTTRHFALFDNHNAISTGTLNILECVRMHCPEARVFLTGSAMQFKNDGQPIDEQTPFEAGSPYSVARIQSVYAARYYRNAFGLKIYIGYFFNHDSPLRNEQHVNQKIAKAVQRIAKGSTEKLELGDIEVRKEFNYAGDMVAAAWKLLEQEMVFEAVIGCGKTHSIKEWLACCFEKTGRKWQDFVTIKKDFVPEYRLLVSNPQLMSSLGWKPEVDFYQLADMMLYEF
jgi:GDPmannose 4,6-dehydratase